MEKRNEEDIHHHHLHKRTQDTLKPSSSSPRLLKSSFESNKASKEYDLDSNSLLNISEVSKEEEDEEEEDLSMNDNNNNNGEKISFNFSEQASRLTKSPAKSKSIMAVESSKQSLLLVDAFARRIESSESLQSDFSKSKEGGLKRRTSSSGGSSKDLDNNESPSQHAQGKKTEGATPGSEKSISVNNESQITLQKLQGLKIEEEIYASLDGSITCYKGRDLHSLLYVQVKRVLRDFEDKRVIHDAIYESRQLRKLRQHSRIATFIAWYSTARHYWVVSEFFASGTLREFLVHHPLETESVKFIAKDIGAGLLFLHENGMVHCDVRPESISLTENGIAKLSSFSMIHFQDGESETVSIERLTEHFVQCAEYCAPEVLKTCVNSSSPKEWSLLNESPSSDVWSLGITLYEASIGSLPFTGTSFVHLFERIISDEPHYYKEKSSTPFSISPFLKLLLKKHSSERPTGEELRNALTQL